MKDDIYPKTPVATLNRSYCTEEGRRRFDLEIVSAVTGMSPTFIKKVLGSPSPDTVSLDDVIRLLDQDAFSETFVPRSQIPTFLLSYKEPIAAGLPATDAQHQLVCGNAADLLVKLPERSIPCVVTSTPYWAMRLYDQAFSHAWADREVCPLGNEQTPEGFIRHTVEILFLIKRILTTDGSVWWNLMDSYNTRTQIRTNASETLNAMRGNDKRGWRDHERRRYSAGHAYLKDGEQCLIPARVATRASRIGYYVKSSIVWKKNGSLPETVGTRVTREIEHILHLSITRSPYFDKGAFLRTPPSLGGRQKSFEAEKVTDVWHLSTASGLDGHGAQFPIALPGRCIALSTRKNDVVLDPFVGSGTTCLAALLLGRRAIGFDISERYLAIARKRLTTRGVYEPEPTSEPPRESLQQRLL